MISIVDHYGTIIINDNDLGTAVAIRLRDLTFLPDLLIRWLNLIIVALTFCTWNGTSNADAISCGAVTVNSSGLVVLSLPWYL